MREVTVRGVAETGLAMQVEVGPHVLRGDEPADQGGTDTGPEPHALMLAALGTCTVMTLRLYAQRKGWPLTNVRVRLTGGKGEGHYAITRHLTLEGALDAEQRQRLVEIADKCPVHRTLTGQIVISTSEGAQ
jgi:putative redox protein